MNSYKLAIVETQCLASHCSIKRSPIETQGIASLLLLICKYSRFNFSIKNKKTVNGNFFFWA
ncbi:MAG: hypothetical protein LBB88_08695 [Planctomycetaceae bacterium]|nr:hypothetical protein [Planctomycetaceae bacterium]